METPLGKALKTVSKHRKKRVIRVCANCGWPLIWTFAFAYNERFCLNCLAPSEMFDGNPDEPASRERIFQKKLVDAIWGVIYGKKGFMPSGKFGRSGCKKDNREGRYASSCDDHRAHLSETEKEWDRIARKYLKRLKGRLGKGFC